MGPLLTTLLDGTSLLLDETSRFFLLDEIFLLLDGTSFLLDETFLLLDGTSPDRGHIDLSVSVCMLAFPNVLIFVFNF